MKSNMWNNDKEIVVSVQELSRGEFSGVLDQFWTLGIRRGDDEFTLYLYEKTDIQVLIDLLKHEAREIGAYIDE